MGAQSIQAGDRVVGTQIPGVFTVVAVEGVLATILSDQGLEMRVLTKGLRRLDGATPAPKDA